MLQSFCLRASNLPPTLNHGDLRSRNAAELDDGRIVLYNWDDAVIGPAGLSLQGLFSGCCRVQRAFANTDTSAKTDNTVSALEAYVTALVTAGYADENTLRESLPASAFVGVLYTLMRYGEYPTTDKSRVADIAKTFQRRLSDLLDLCDRLSFSRRSWCFSHAKDHIKHGRAYRAEQMLMSYRTAHPNDPDVLEKLALAQRENKNWDGLITTYRRHLKKSPKQAKLHNNLGIALTKTRDYAQAINCFQTALAIAPDLSQAKTNLRRVSDIIKTFTESEQPHIMPRVTLLEDEQRSHIALEDKRYAATQLFRQHGTLVLENLFSRDQIIEIRQQVMAEYDQYFEEKNHEDALRIGDKRYMITLEVKGPINSPDIYAPPLLRGLLEDILGNKYNIGGINAAVSLPGAEDQRLHKDHPALFLEQGRDFRTPPFAVSMLIPLVEMTPEMGPTRVYKGSHLLSSEKSRVLPHQTPIPSLGSCLLMDYRLTHHGLANRSDTVRPLLCIIFHRPWFKDYINYSKQDALKINHAEYADVPEQFKRLFSDTAVIEGD